MGKWTWTAAVVSGASVLWLLASCAWLDRAAGYVGSPEGQDAGQRAVEGLGKIATGNPVGGLFDISEFVLGLIVGGGGGAAAPKMVQAVNRRRQQKKEAPEPGVH